MELGLEGKLAIVCGSSQGIGFSIAFGLAEHGAQVCLFARDENALKEALSKLPGQGHSYLVADFNQPEEVKAATEDFLKDKHVDILINNSGGPPGGPILEATSESFLEAYNRHLLCNHLLVQAVVPGMKKAGGGKIINIISTSVKEPLAGLGVSNTTRGAVASWAKTMSSELGPDNITVNNVLPGATNTKRLSDLLQAKSEKTGQSVEDLLKGMTSVVPLGRVAEAKEVANMAVFLASSAADYVSGQSIAVDGGRTRTI